MKLKLLALMFGIFCIASDVYAACGIASGTDYTIGSNTNTSCAPPLGTTSVTVNSGITLNGGNSQAGLYISTLEDLSTLNNSGTITSSTSNSGVYVGNPSGGSIATINNYATGTISNGNYGIVVDYPASSIGAINNQNLITGGWAGIDNFGVVNAINNSGTFSQTTIGGGYGSAINNHEYIGAITNQVSGVISGPNGGITNDSARAIGIEAITNLGTITSSAGYGINNSGGIGTFNNGQGAGNSAGAVTYTGALPTNYNIIINGSTNFGKLVVTTGTGSTTFGISSLSIKGALALGPYSSIIVGLANTQLGVTGTSKTGTSNGYGYTLTERITTSGSEVWDLSILSAPDPAPPAPTGPSTANTQASLANTVQPLQGTFTVLNTALANSLTYDCQVFDKNNICISAGGRNTAVSAANGLNNTSALLIAAYRVMPTVRVGAYADQNLSVNNAGSTVNLGNNTPLIGLFGAWNERLDGTGTEVKVSAAYGQKNTTVTRSVVGTGATASEAGNGGAPINSQGAQVTAKYGFGVVENVIVSPYAGIRYTQNNMGGYAEGASSAVTAPLTYSSLNTNATTALAGVGASYRFIPQATAFASAGVETDTNTANGSYSATGVTGLTPINFNANPVKTRPTAMVGATYDVEKNQRIGVTGIYRQEPYQAVSTTTVMATYTVGL